MVSKHKTQVYKNISAILESSNYNWLNFTTFKWRKFDSPSHFPSKTTIKSIVVILHPTRE